MIMTDIPVVALLIELAFAVAAAGTAWGFLQGRIKNLERDNAELRQWKADHDKAALEMAAMFARMEATVNTSAEDIKEMKVDIKDVKRTNGGHDGKSNG